MAVFAPHTYQAEAIQRIIDQPSAGLFMDMGLGKTVVTLTAVDALIYDHLAVRRALVIAPKKVAEATWQAEAAKWDHLQRLRISTAVGTARQRAEAVEDALWGYSDIVVINRENVEWLVETYGKTWCFDLVVVDESSSFKNPSAKRFRALKRIMPKISRTVILTGTPAPNGIEDLWSQIYLLDRGERLGRYVTHYRERYFDYNPWRHEYTPKPGAFDAIQAKIGDLCVSMKAGDYLQLPELVIHDVPVALDDKARKAYRQMEREMMLSIGDEEITAMNAAALTGKLLQLCGGAVYDENGASHRVHDAKLDALSELIEQLHGEHALLFYGFRQELPRILSRLHDRNPGGWYRVRMLENAADAAAWNRGEVDVLLAHPASCAYGLNLQQGGRHVIWYTLTWSLELYQQANARLYRQGQEKPVIVHRLLTQGGVDEDVAKALVGKVAMQEALIEVLKAKREAVA